jgi:hypothetical protein
MIFHSALDSSRDAIVENRVFSKEDSICIPITIVHCIAISREDIPDLNAVRNLLTCQRHAHLPFILLRRCKLAIPGCRKNKRVWNENHWKHSQLALCAPASAQKSRVKMTIRSLREQLLAVAAGFLLFCGEGRDGFRSGQSATMDRQISQTDAESSVRGPTLPREGPIGTKL